MSPCLVLTFIFSVSDQNLELPSPGSYTSTDYTILQRMPERLGKDTLESTFIPLPSLPLPFLPLPFLPLPSLLPSLPLPLLSPPTQLLLCDWPFTRRGARGPGLPVLDALEAGQSLPLPPPPVMT